VGDVFIPGFYLKEGKEDWKEKYEKVVMCPRCNVLLANVSFLIPFCLLSDSNLCPQSLRMSRISSSDEKPFNAYKLLLPASTVHVKVKKINVYLLNIVRFSVAGNNC
jgi:hypothetical protein